MSPLSLPVAWQPHRSFRDLSGFYFPAEMFAQLPPPGLNRKRVLVSKFRRTWYQLSGPMFFSGAVVECRLVGCGFFRRLGHIKDCKIAPLLGTQRSGLELGGLIIQ